MPSQAVQALFHEKEVSPCKVAPLYPVFLVTAHRFCVHINVLVENYIITDG